MIQVRKTVLRGSNACSTAIEKDGGGTGIIVDFYRGDRLSELNVLYTTDVLKGVLQVKDYKKVHMVIYFVTGYMDRTTGLVEQTPMTRFQTMNPRRLVL